MSLCEIFIQEYESKCDSLRCELESSEWVFKNSLIGPLTFLEEGNEAVETLLGKAKARYPDSAVLWKYIEREYQLIPFLQSALGLKVCLSITALLLGFTNVWGVICGRLISI